MRINLSKSKHTSFNKLFLDINIKEFAKNYDIKIADATVYIKSGEQGLEAFSNFLNEQGYHSSVYILYPNKTILRPFHSITVDQQFNSDGDQIDKDGESIYGQIEADKIESPSYGIVIKDDDEKLVEFKLTNM